MVEALTIAEEEIERPEPCRTSLTKRHAAQREQTKRLPEGDSGHPETRPAAAIHRLSTISQKRR